MRTVSAFPVYDPFNYTAGATLWGQTDANGDYWWEIDSSGSAATAVVVSSFGPLTYPGLPASPGQSILLTNASSGQGGRMFVSTNSALNFFGNAAGPFPGPISVFYSLVIEVTNMNNLSTTGDYCFGFNDQGAIASQGSNPGTMCDVVYFRKGNGTDYPATNYQIGISKYHSTPPYYAANLFTVNQPVFIVVDVEINDVGEAGTQQNDICRLWVNPASSTFGAATQPTETVSEPAGVENNMTPYTSCFIFENRATDTPNDLLVGQFRLGTNWSWVTGGPAIVNTEPATTNVYGTGFTLNITAPNNGSANSCQWLLNGTNLTNGPSISGSGATVSGATNSVLTIANATSSDNGSYSVIVNNAIGSVSNLVTAVTVYVPLKPTFQSEPSPASVSLYPGGSVLISFTASGTAPIVYYWYTNSALAVVTTNNPSVAFSNVASTAVGYCVASNYVGTNVTSPFSIIVLPLPSAPYPLAVLNDHPVDFLPLNEQPDNASGDNGTNAYDYVGANDGIYTNAIIGLPGYGPGLASQFGYATPTDTNTSAEFGFYPSYPANDSFVGQIQNVTFAASSFGPSFSIEAWAQGSTSGEPSGATIVSKGWGSSANGNGDQFTLDYSTGWQFYVRNASGNTTAALSANTSATDGNWHHLVGVLSVSNDLVLLYVDGALQATNNTYAPTVGIYTTLAPVTIGSRMSAINSDYNYNFYGNIQNVAIYNYALTPAQIQNHYYAAGLPAQITQPPVSSTNLSYGNTLVLTAAATGTSPLSFQWIDENTGLPVPGQTNSTLVISNLTASDTYYFVAANTYATNNSSPTSVTVYKSPAVVQDITPIYATVIAGSSISFSVGVDGAATITYWWQLNGNTVTNSSRISGAGSNVLTISPAQMSDAGTYQLFASNTYGGPVSSSQAVLTVSPTNGYAATVVEAGPLVYYTFSDVGASSHALNLGSLGAAYNGLYEGGYSAGPGPRPPQFPNLDSNNLAVVFDGVDTDVKIPALNLTTNASFGMTLAAWINPLGAQEQYAGIVFHRGTDGAAGIGVMSDPVSGGDMLEYHWNSLYYGNSSYLDVTNNQWQFVALVVQPTQAVICLNTGTGFQTWTNTAPHNAEQFSDTTYVGFDASDGISASTRRFYGSIDEPMIFNTALSASELGCLYQAALEPQVLALQIGKSGRNITLAWPLGTLQTAAQVGGPYTNMPAASSPYTFTPTNTQQYFRLQARTAVTPSTIGSASGASFTTY